MDKIGSDIEFNNFVFRFDIIRQNLNDSIYYQYMNVECKSFIDRILLSYRFLNYIEIKEYVKNVTSFNLNICINYYNISKADKEYIINKTNLLKINLYKSLYFL